MDIYFYNTLTNEREKFTPISAPDVYMYNCGPTVYDYAHIGNFRAFVFADILRRSLELAGYNVHQVMNLTDVGHMTDDSNADGGGQDKMAVAMERVKEAKKSGKLPPGAVANPDDPYQIAQFYIDAFLADAKMLGIKIADEYPEKMPRATQYVAQMQSMIRKLIDAGHAYVGPDGAVYYSVESFPDYGQLSGNTLDQIRRGAGGRVSDEHQAAKKHPADFLLWKPDKAHVMKWDSPWGPGYPGWHIECSAMATSLLGRNTIDIHTGGEDNIFPHHECEIAQTRGATGESTFARYWMHTRYLLVEGAKMSKSKGNFYTVRDLLAKGATPAAIRFELLRAHYRSNMNFTLQGLEDARRNVQRLRDAAARFEKEAAGKTAGDIQDHPTLKAFREALADDLNMAGALGELFKWLSNPTDAPEVSLAVLRQVDRVLNVLADAVPAAQSASQGDDEIQAKCDSIAAARQAKDYATADRLRKELTDAGYEIQISKDGVTARRKLV
jgi:cysteinyl-tRNA synthetase